MVTLTWAMGRSTMPAAVTERTFGSLPAISTIVRFEHGANSLDRQIESSRDLLDGCLELAPPGKLGVELLRQFRAIGAERLDLSSQGLNTAVGIASTLGRRFQGIECGDQPAGSPFDRAYVDCRRFIAFGHRMWSTHPAALPRSA